MSYLERRINRLYRKAELLKKLRKVLNEIKHNGAYSEVNAMKELNRLEVAEKCSSKQHQKQIAKEKQVLYKTMKIRQKLANQLMQDLEELLNEIEKEV